VRRAPPPAAKPGWMTPHLRSSPARRRRPALKPQGGAVPPQTPAWPTRPPPASEGCGIHRLYHQEGRSRLGAVLLGLTVESVLRAHPHPCHLGSRIRLGGQRSPLALTQRRAALQGSRRSQLVGKWVPKRLSDRWRCEPAARRSAPGHAFGVAQPLLAPLRHLAGSSFVHSR
jgi:hypothetical protein